FARWCKRNPGLSAATITATLLTVLLAIGTGLAAWTYRNQRNQLAFEQALTKSSLKRAEESGRTARLELGSALMAEGVALQHSGLMGQRFDSLDRLARAAQELRDDPEGHARLAELRDHAITAMGLTDLRVRWQRKIGTVMSNAVDRQHNRYAVIEPHSGQAVVRRMDDDRELLRVPRPDFRFWFAFPGLSPDGRYLLVHYANNGVSDLTDLWHIERRERVFHEPVRGGAFAFHPDGRRIVLTLSGKDLVVWDLAARRELRRLPLAFRPECLSLDPTGRRVAANAAELDQAGSGQVQILDLETGHELAAWKGLLGDSALSWSGDGQLIATGHDHGRVFVWDVARGRLDSVLQGHTNRVIGCGFAPAGHLLATNSWDGTARLWDASTGEPLLSLSRCSPLDFSSNGNQLAFQSGPTLGTWDVAHDHEVRMLNPGLIGNQTVSRKDDGVRAADFDPDGTLVALGTREGAYVYDALSGQELARLESGPCATVLFDRQGQNLITCGDRGLFRWPIRSDPNGGANALRVGPPELLHEATADPSGWNKTHWLPDHRTLVMIDNENARVVLVDTAQPHPARNRAPCLSSGSNRRMTSIAVSPDGRWAAAGGWKEDGIYIWDLPRRKLDCILPPSDDNFDCTFAVSFSPDGRWLASCSHNPSAPGHYLWDVGTWKRHSYLPEHHGFLASPVFSHDGRLLARNVSLQQIRLVEVATGRTIAHLSTLQPLKQTPLAFSPDGTRLIASTNRKTALLYDLRRIREQLQTMDLDWDQPPFPEEPKAPIPAPVRSIRVVGEVQEPQGLADELPSRLADEVLAGGP
ncbi:MAG TPA: hypothetical protein VJY33_11950, partial [Isosphaeraceae bacterium]|nr:hypothetical protein [Isosphaeraceae bacterium]